MTYDLIGRQLGAYRVDALIGAGGMAEVYKAYQPSMERYVALKALDRRMTSTAEFLELFKREARLIASLQHTHILPVFDFGEAEGHAYLVMPLMENGTIATRVRGKRLPLDQVIRVGVQVGDALSYAHGKGMVHRDVKPGNILLDTHGNCLLSDFGIARLTADSATSENVLAGTPAYMAPEQAEDLPIDGRTDLYALGVVLYELATGQRPFEAPDALGLVYKHVHSTPRPPRSLDGHIPEQLEWIILHALAKQPAGRFESASEMVRALRAVTIRSRTPAMEPAVLSQPPQPRSKAAEPAPGTPDARTVIRPKTRTPADGAAQRSPDRTQPLPAAGRSSPPPPGNGPRGSWRLRLPRLALPRFPRPRGGPAAQWTRTALRWGLGGALLFVVLVLLISAGVNLARSVAATPTAAATVTYAAFAELTPTSAPMVAPVVASTQPGAAEPAAVAPTETPLGQSAAAPVVAAQNCAIAAHPDLPMAGALAGQAGCPTQARVAARAVSVQRFERGLMIAFATTGGAIGRGSAIYVLAGDNRAWRFTSAWSQRSTTPDSWYSCNAQPGLTPAQSGVPWRSFGAIWCADPDIAAALGAAQGDELSGLSADFQAYKNGRVFRVTNWPDAAGRVYTVALRDARSGEWR